MLFNKNIFYYVWCVIYLILCPFLKISAIKLIIKTRVACINMYIYLYINILSPSFKFYIAVPPSFLACFIQSTYFFCRKIMNMKLLLYKSMHNSIYVKAVIIRILIWYNTYTSEVCIKNSLQLFALLSGRYLI